MKPDRAHIPSDLTPLALLGAPTVDFTHLLAAWRRSSPVARNELSTHGAALVAGGAERTEHARRGTRRRWRGTN